jgi:hypothetical protein
VLLAVLPFVCLLVGGLCGVVMGRHGKGSKGEGALVPRGDLVGAIGFSLMAVIVWVATSQSDLDSALRFLPLGSLVIGFALGLAIGVATRRTK